MQRLTVLVAVFMVGVVLSCLAAETPSVAGRPVRASISVGMEYTDNRDSSAGDKEDSLDWILNGRVDALLDWTQTVLDFYYMPSLRYRSNPSVIQRDADLYHDLGVSVEHRLSQRLKLSANEHFNFTDDPAVDVGGNVLRRDSSFILNRVKAAADYDFSRRLTGSASGYHTTKRYEDDVVAKQGDEDSIGGGVSAAFILDRDLIVALVGGVGMVGYNEESGVESRDFQSYECGVAVTRRYGIRTKGELAVGWKMLSFESDELGTESSPYASLGLLLALSPRTRFSGSLGYLLRDSDFYPFASQRYLTLDCGAEWDALVQRLTLRVNGGYRVGSYDSGSLRTADREQMEANGLPTKGDETVVLASVGVNWRIQKTYAVCLAQQYEHVDYDGALESFSRNSTRLTVTRDF